MVNIDIAQRMNHSYILRMHTIVNTKEVKKDKYLKTDNHSVGSETERPLRFEDLMNCTLCILISKLRKSIHIKYKLFLGGRGVKPIQQISFSVD